MTPEAEAAAIRSVDRANELQMVGGYALSIVGLLLFFHLVLGKRRDQVPTTLVVLAILMCVGGLVLANWLLAI